MSNTNCTPGATLQLPYTTTSGVKIGQKSISLSVKFGSPDLHASTSRKLFDESGSPSHGLHHHRGLEETNAVREEPTPSEDVDEAEEEEKNLYNEDEDKEEDENL